MTRRREGRRAVATPPPLGSMSQQSAVHVPGTQTCWACGSTDLVRIRMGAPTGRPLVFVSCRACEQTAWFAQDGDGTVLGADGSPVHAAPVTDEDDEADQPDEGGQGDERAEDDEDDEDDEGDEDDEATPDVPLAGNAR